MKLKNPDVADNSFKLTDEERRPTGSISQPFPIKSKVSFKVSYMSNKKILHTTKPRKYLYPLLFRKRHPKITIESKVTRAIRRYIKKVQGNNIEIDILKKSKKIMLVVQFEI